MPTTLPDLILLDAAAGTGAGPGIGFGQSMRYANGVGTNNLNAWPRLFKARVELKDSTTGASATVLIQTSPDNVTYTTIDTYTLSLAAGTQQVLARTYKTASRWFRANVSALAGGSAPVVNAYCTYGSFGQ